MYQFSPLYPTKEKNLFCCIPHKKTLPLYPTMEEILFRCISQQEKSLLLYPTMEENFFQCEIQRKKTCGVVGYNVEDYSALHPTSLLRCINHEEKAILRCGIQCRKSFCEVGYSTPHKLLLWCGIQRKKKSCVVGYNGKNLLAIQILFSIVSHDRKNLFLCVHNGGKPSPLYPTTEKNSSFVSHNGKNRFRCIPQRKKLFLCIPQRKKPLCLYPTTAKKLKT